MDIVRNSRHQAGRIVSLAGVLLATLLPAIAPVVASADTVTERSIALSSSATSKEATYNVVFTSPSNVTSLDLTFCTTPSGTCTTPTGFSAVDAATTTTGYTVATGATVQSVGVDVTTPGTDVDVELTGITNPSEAGVFYARINTYAAAYASHGTAVNSGTVALSATDGFAVGGSVAETMTFCATDNGSTIGSGCTGTLGAPDIDFGTLSTTPVTGTIKTQISTNAVNGAVVSLKSDAVGCGGLVREGSTVSDSDKGCGIPPLTTPNTTSTLSGTAAAEFGLQLGTLGGTTGTTAAIGSSYDTTHYYMGYNSTDESTGVTSTYGDPVYNTSGAPISDGTADLTFGAVASNVTPAGTYKASFNLIATGTF